MEYSISPDPLVLQEPFLQSELRKPRFSDLFRQAAAKYALLAALGCLFLAAITFFVAHYLAVGVDFHIVFLPTAFQYLSGQFHSDLKFYNPPWIALYLIPFTLFPENLSWGLFTAMGLALYIFVYIRLGAKPFELLLLVTAPQTLYGLWHGNIDSLVLVGAVIPPAAGIWFLMMKPQMGMILVLVWLKQGLKTDGWRKTFLRFAPFGAVSLLCLALGTWKLPVSSQMVADLPWNTSKWPLGIPFGLLLAAYALWKDDAKSALAASPLLSPYLAVHSWITCGFMGIGRAWFLGIFWAGSWAAVIFNYLTAG